jgi:predicted CopG family antitoxin
MKATIEIPDELYRKVKAKAAMEGKSIREVTIDLYERWIRGGDAPEVESPKEWLSRVFQMADDSMKVRIADAPSAGEYLRQDRSRLDTK